MGGDCDIIKSRKGMLFSSGEIHVFIGHRLQHTLGGTSMSHGSAILCVMVYSAVLTKVKLGDAYM